MYISLKGDIAVVREVTENDLNGLLHLYEQLHNSEVTITPDELLKLWNQIIQDNNHHIIVAEEDGKIVSSCVCVIIPNLTHNQQPYAFIENVITDEAYRKKGLRQNVLIMRKKLRPNRNVIRLCC